MYNWFFRLIFFKLIFISCGHVLAQTDEAAAHVRTFDSIYYIHYYKTRDIYTNGQRLLKLAKNDVEKARALNIIADAFYKQGKYLEAVKKLEIADSLAKNDNQWRMIIGNLLIRAYLEAGISSQAEEQLEIIKSLKVANPIDQEIYSLLSKAKILEYNKKYCEAIPYRSKILGTRYIDLSVGAFKNLEIERNKRILLSYPLLKCGKIKEAGEQLAIIDSLVIETKYPPEGYLMETYYLCKGLYSVATNSSKIESKKWFNKSYQTAFSNDAGPITKNIIDEILESGIYSPLEKSELVQHLLVLAEKYKIESQDLVNYVVMKKENLVHLKQKREKLWMVGFFIVILLAGAFIYYVNNKRNKDKKAYYRILSELKSSDMRQDDIKFEKIPSEDSFNKSPIDEKLEYRLVNALEIFEKKNQFLAKDISSAQMASILRTTPRNLTYIIKKYRDSDFYNYINDYRIQYIVRELKENTLLRKYKIATLSEMCGYRSHSQFTTIFKLKKGISPSQYIQFLEKEKMET